MASFSDWITTFAACVSGGGATIAIFINARATLKFQTSLETPNITVELILNKNSSKFQLQLLVYNTGRVPIMLHSFEGIAGVSIPTMKDTPLMPFSHIAKFDTGNFKKNEEIKMCDLPNQEIEQFYEQVKRNRGSVYLKDTAGKHWAIACK